MGLELCFGLLSKLIGQHGLELSRLIEALSTNPATIAGISPPTLRAGALAECALVNPGARWVPEQTALLTKSRNSPFMKHELIGRVELTLANGGVAFDSLRGDS
jgi:dihydroorotase